MRHNQVTTSRRGFLARAAAAVLAAPAVFPSGLIGLEGRPGPNEQVSIGFVGSGHRARLLMKQVPAAGRIVAVSDCHRRRSEEAVKENGADWKVHADYRKLLDDAKIDAVIVPTTDHGRVLACIHACQAGKDIYAEKPLSLTVREGRALVNAVRKHGRVFQTGSQQRSMEMNRFACELVRTGKLGNVLGVQCQNYPGPGGGGQRAEQPVPGGLNWDQWLGQVEMRPYHEDYFRGWMGFRDFAGGEMTNWGAHGLDQLQWALGADATGPVEVWPEGTEPNAPLSYRYASGVVVKLELKEGPWGGAVFTCEKGKITIDRNRFTVDPADLVRDVPPAQTAEIWEGPGWQARYHIQNWLECIKSRGKPVADAEIGHRSITVAHLGNIARRLGRRLQWDPVKELFAGDEEANRHLERPRRKGYELPDPA
jgi:predicted dehydrogenase